MRTLCAPALACALLVGIASQHLRVSGTRFQTADGHPFDWRGITAFRLVEFAAHGRQQDADAYLTWAASKRLTVVRVLAMADVLFKLSPGDGRRALPTLLSSARAHGLYVEVVALADTTRLRVNLEEQVRAVGSICAAAPNCLLEIANEPTHPTQAVALHDPSRVAALAGLVPTGVPVSLGSVESGDAYGAGTYVTWHPPRARWVTSLDAGRGLLSRFDKPVIADEPIGAADRTDPGRRDSDPGNFEKAAASLRAMGLGATFHYEGGLQARVPDAQEMRCLDAWLRGLGVAQ